MIREMKCKGQFGSYDCSEADRVDYGNLKCIRDLVLYESDEANGLKAAIEEAVVDCLAKCEAEVIESNKALNGNFSVRPERELHHRTVTSAQRQGVNSVRVKTM